MKHFILKKINIQHLLLSSLSLLVISCGGGGSSESNTRIGQFTGTTVSGLRFVTETHSGNTNSEGEFEYETGETIRFYVGDVLIGDTLAQDTITPFTLAGISPPVDAKEIKKAMGNNQYYDEFSAEVLSQYKKVPFEHAINIAVFLQTIDSDADSSNGVQISEAIHSVASRHSIVFNQRSYRFKNDSFSFRKLLASGRAEGIWGGSREVINPSIALDMVYSSLGLTPNIYLETKYENDRENDGIIDFTAEYDYNLNGMLETYAGSSSTTKRFYGTNGKLIRIDTDNTPFGSVNKRVSFEYDLNGNQIKRREINEVGADDVVITKTFDENGSLKSAQVDKAPFGSIDKSYAYTYNSQGKVKKETIEGTTNRIVYSYYTDNKLSRREIDRDADGSIDFTSTHTYNSKGMRTTFDNGDTHVFYQSEFPYDVTRVEGDYNDDGIIDSQTFYYYNEKNLLIKIESDRAPLGSINKRVTIEYDQNDFYISVASEHVRDGTITRTTTRKYQYDSNGNILKKTKHVDDNVEAVSSSTSQFILHSKWGDKFSYIGTLGDHIR